MMPRVLRHAPYIYIPSKEAFGFLHTYFVWASSSSSHISTYPQLLVIYSKGMEDEALVAKILCTLVRIDGLKIRYVKGLIWRSVLARKRKREPRPFD